MQFVLYFLVQSTYSKLNSGAPKLSYWKKYVWLKNNQQHVDSNMVEPVQRIVYLKQLEYGLAALMMVTFIVANLIKP